MLAKFTKWCLRIYRRAALPLRKFFLGNLLAEMGEGCRIFSWPKVYYPENIKFGRNVTINHGVILEGRGGIKIGDDVRISPYVVLETGYLQYNMREREHCQKEIIIKNNVWLASRSTILAGVTVGEGAVVAAGAIVTKDVPAYHIAMGVPAVFKPIITE